MKLQWRLAVTGDHVTLEINLTDICRGERASLTRADVNQQRVVVEPDACVTIVIDDFGRLEHPDTIDKILL
jgi:hypothetical protein